MLDLNPIADRAADGDFGAPADNRIQLVSLGGFEHAGSGLTGTIFVFSNLEMAKQFAVELGEIAERRDRHVRVSTDVQWTLSGPAEDQAEAVGKAGDTIDIWHGEAPPDSPFPPNEEISSRQRRGEGHIAKPKWTSKPAAATHDAATLQP